MATKYLDSTGVGILWGKTKEYANARKTEIINQKGAANGFASLDANGRVPLAQLGNLDTSLYIIPADNKPPTTGIKTNKIYLIKENSETDNVYTEYIYVNNAWEILGKFAVKVDLTPYATTSAMNTALDNKVDKVGGKGLSTNDFTTALLTKLNGIAEGANKTVVDSALSVTSTNPVQNMVVNDAINDLQYRLSEAETKADASVTSITFGQTSGDAIWEVIKNDGTSTSGSFPEAQKDYAGMMSAKDKTKLDKINIAMNGSINLSYDDGGAIFFVPGQNDEDDFTFTVNESFLKFKGTKSEVTLRKPSSSGTLATEESVKGKYVEQVGGKGLSTNDYTSAEKTKLAGIPADANHTTVDAALNTTSANPVQNKIVASSINSINTSITTINTTLGNKLNASDIAAITSTELATILV